MTIGTHSEMNSYILMGYELPASRLKAICISKGDAFISAILECIYKSIAESAFQAFPNVAPMHSQLTLNNESNND